MLSFFSCTFWFYFDTASPLSITVPEQYDPVSDFCDSATEQILLLVKPKATVVMCSEEKELSLNFCMYVM